MSEKEWVMSEKEWVMSEKVWVMPLFEPTLFDQ